MFPIGPTTPPPFALVVFKLDAVVGRGFRNDCLGSFVVSFCRRSSWRERNDCSGSDVVVIVLTSFVYHISRGSGMIQMSNYLWASIGDGNGGLPNIL